MERKTPRRAGCSPPYEPTPLGGVRWCGWLGTGYQADLRVHPCPGSRCADRLPLRCCLRTAVVAWGIFSGLLVFASYFFPCKRAGALRGPYSFFSGEERIWKERRRAGRGGPRPTYPPPWVGVEGAGGIVLTTRQICECIRALIAGEQTACRFAVAYALRWGLDGFFRGCTLFRLNGTDFREGG